MRLRIALICAVLACASPADARDSDAGAPSDVSVTIYRDPQRNGGNIRLERLGGFAVITETRRVTLPAGRSTLRFVGVVDGIIPESAVISGLPGGVIEKNQDAALLSPASLLRATQGKLVQLKRSNRDTGKSELVEASVIAANSEGVTFRTSQGTETLRCSGLPETFRYNVDTATGSAKPVLSVATTTARPVSATVKLTYLAEGFDWSASYNGEIDRAAQRMNVGGWITLANANAISLENAQVQIVAGGLRREAYRRLLDGSYQEEDATEGYDDGAQDIVVTSFRRSGSAPAPVMEVAPPPPPPPPPPEQLGDLKLYRIPYRTTIAARQMKQTRLLANQGVEFETIQILKLPAIGPSYVAADLGDLQHFNPVTYLRTRNDKAHQLGMPLPAGAFVIGQMQDDRPAMLGQPNLRDTAENEKIELPLGASPDISVSRRTIASTKKQQTHKLTIANAAAETRHFEMRFTAWGSQRIVEADAELSKEDGEQMFRLDLPPNSTKVITYRVRWD